MLLPLLLNNLLPGGGGSYVTLDLGVDTPVRVDGVFSLLSEDTAVLQNNVSLTLGSAVAVQIEDLSLNLTSKAAVKQENVSKNLTSKAAIQITNLATLLSADTGVGTHYLVLACSAAVQSMIGGNSQAILLRPRTAVQVQYAIDLVSRAAVQAQLLSIGLDADTVVSLGAFNNLSLKLFARTAVKAARFLQLGADAGVADEFTLGLDIDSAVEAEIALLLTSVTAVVSEDLSEELAVDTVAVFPYEQALLAKAAVLAKDVYADLSADAHVLSNLYLNADTAVGTEDEIAWLFPDLAVAERRVRQMATTTAVATSSRRSLTQKTAVMVEDRSSALSAAAGVLVEGVVLSLDSATAVQMPRVLDLIRDAAVQEERNRNLLCTSFVSDYALRTAQLSAGAAIADQFSLALAVEAAIGLSHTIALASATAVALRLSSALSSTTIVAGNGLAASLNAKTAVRTPNASLNMAVSSAVRIRPSLALAVKAAVFGANRSAALGATTVVRGAKPGIPRSIPYGTRRV